MRNRRIPSYARAIVYRSRDPGRRSRNTTVKQYGALIHVENTAWDVASGGVNIGRTPRTGCGTNLTTFLESRYYGLGGDSSSTLQESS